MKYTIRMVIVLLAVFTAASCDLQPKYEEPEEESEPIEKVNVSMIVKDDADSTRITNASIEFDGGRYTDKVMTTNGIFEDSVETQDAPVFAFAYADGYEQADTLQLDLTKDVDEVIYLSKKEGEPEPEGPGEISISSTCSDEGGVGDVTISVEKNADYLAVIDESGEIVREADVTIRDGGTYTFEEVTSGTYRGLAKVKGVEEASKSEETTVLECEVPDDRINGYVKVANEDSVRIDDAQITFNGGPYNHKVVSPNGIFDEVLDKQDVDIDISVSADGYKEVDPVTVSLNDDFREIFILEKKTEPEPEGPGEIIIDKVTCSENGDGKISGTVENGFSYIKLVRDGNQVDSQDGNSASSSQQFEFTGLDSGDYTIVANKNEQTSSKDVTVEACPQEPPTASFTTSSDWMTISYDASESSDPDGQIVEYRWDFDNDGTIDATTSNPTTEHTFESEGTFTTRLVVEDDDGLTDETTNDVHPEKEQTMPPSCPLTSGTVVHFDDNRIRSDQGKAEARTQAANVNLSAGEYRVKLYGYDQHDDRAGQNQTNESYYVSLMQDGQEVVQTDELGDLPDGNNLGERTTTIDGVILESDVDKVQGIHAAYPSGSANSLNAACASFERTGDVPLSNEYTHEIEVIAEKKIWVSGDQNRLEDTFVSHGEVEPIRTEKDPYGIVKVEARFKLDEDQVDTEHFALEFYYNQDGSDAFRTPIYLDQSGVDGWTTGTVELDAKHFEGHAKDLAGIRIVHGDNLNNDKPSGPDDIIFATGNDNGLLKLYWRTVDDGKSKMLKSYFETKAYQELNLK